MTLNYKQAAKIAAAAWNGGQRIEVTLRKREGRIEYRVGKERAWRDAG